MDQEKQKLYDRIIKLKNWQIELVLIDFMNYSTPKQLEAVEKEVSISEGIIEEAKQKNSPRANVN